MVAPKMTTEVLYLYEDKGGFICESDINDDKATRYLLAAPVEAELATLRKRLAEAEAILAQIPPECEINTPKEMADLVWSYKILLNRGPAYLRIYKEQKSKLTAVTAAAKEMLTFLELFSIQPEFSASSFGDSFARWQAAIRAAEGGGE